MLFSILNMIILGRVQNKNLIHYKQGAFVTVENDVSGDHFFIILKGKVRVESSINNNHLNVNRNLAKGDFFGVIPFMTGNPQNETSFTLEESILFRVDKNGLHQMLEKSNALALKIVRSFSNDLRIYDHRLAELTLKSNQDDVSAEEKLYQNALFYYENKQYRIAAYILLQFIKFFTYSINTPKILEMLKTIDSSYIFPLQNFKQDARRVYLDGQMLVSEFEPGYESFVIEYGKVKITKVINGKEVLLAVLKAGDIFGEMALIDNQGRAASAISYGESSCIVLNTHNFNQLIQSNIQVTIKLITLLSERIWTIYKQLENLSFTNVKTRIYDTLFTQVLKRKGRIAHQAKFLFDFGVSELKKMVGSGNDDFDTSIKEVFDESFLSLYDEKILCLDTLDLKKETEFMKKLEKIKSKKTTTK